MWLSSGDGTSCVGTGEGPTGANWFELGNGTDLPLLIAELCQVTRSPFLSLPSLIILLSLLLITLISNMARGRKPVNGPSPAPAADPSSDSTATPPPRSVLPIPPTPRQSRDVVKVNNASVTELKNALDDAIKRVRIVLFVVALSPNNVIHTHLVVPFPTRSFQANSSPH